MRGGAVAARRAHNPEVAGSNPAPATQKNPSVKLGDLFFLHLLMKHFSTMVFHTHSI